jgi:hypothetical protein
MHETFIIWKRKNDKIILEMKKNLINFEKRNVIING